MLPDEGLNDLADWQARWATGGTITDEGGRTLTADEMLDRITNRTWHRNWDDRAFFGYTNEAEFHRMNYSERGPNGLVRHKVGPYCVGHGAGTWDLIPGDFS